MKSTIFWLLNNHHDEFHSMKTSVVFPFRIWLETAAAALRISDEASVFFREEMGIDVMGH